METRQKAASGGTWIAASIAVKMIRRRLAANTASLSDKP
jgi:hypothetical protein